MHMGGGVLMEKTSSLHLQLYVFNFLPECKQTLLASRHVKFGFGSSVPRNQSAGQNAQTKGFKSNETRKRGNMFMMWNILPVTRDWLFQMKTLVLRVGRGAQSRST